MGLAKLTPDEQKQLDPSLALYVAETAPSSFERHAWLRWFVLALLAVLLHFLLLFFVPGLYRPAPPAPVEVTQIDPAKLAAIKNQWKERGFLLSKDENKPKDATQTPKEARYESDRNRRVERETRARQTNVIPNVAGIAEGKGTENRAGKKKRPATPAEKIPLSNLSNFQGLPMPGKTEEESAASARRGGPGDTGDQALMDDALPVGAENMLNTAESVYYTFYARMYDQIEPLWQSGVREIIYRTRPASGDYVTQVDIVFDSEGNYVQTRMLRGSGNQAFDAAIHAAWSRVPRFPNPPRGLIQSDGKIHMGWTFNVRMDQNTGWQYAPPQQQY